MNCEGYESHCLDIASILHTPPKQCRCSVLAKIFKFIIWLEKTNSNGDRFFPPFPSSVRRVSPGRHHHDAGLENLTTMPEKKLQTNETAKLQTAEVHNHRQQVRQRNTTEYNGHGMVYHIPIMTTFLPPCTIQWVAHYPPRMSAVYDRRRPLSINLEKSSESIYVRRQSVTDLGQLRLIKNVDQPITVVRINPVLSVDKNVGEPG